MGRSAKIHGCFPAPPLSFLVNSNLKFNWQTLRQQTPPPIYPYLPGVSQDEDVRSSYIVPGDLEPGLDERQISRLLSAELGVGSSVAMPAKRSTAKSKSPCGPVAYIPFD